MSANECDISVVLGALVVFALPLTLLLPNFSVWDVIPKLRVTRFYIISSDITWAHLNAAVIILVVVFFSLYLEIRKRKLDDMVQNVLSVSQATDAAMEVETVRQAAAVKACLQLLDASTDHYEHLSLLRGELRRRDKMKRQHPPVIELSSSEFQ